jgi:glycosyltransferase involved in cell wall biosynthesis
MKIAYLTGEYPRATDTFIQREVFNLRKQGLEVRTYSIRKPSGDHLVGEEQKAERARTDYLLPVNPLLLVWAHLFWLLRQPANYIKAIKLTWQTSQPGIKGGMFQVFYFWEAGILAYKLRQNSIDHLHNHIANSSCTVAMLAATISGGTFSFTLHGPHIFFEPHRWRLDEKIRQAQFVSCISHFCRSQAMLFVSPDHWAKLKIIHCGVEPDLFTPVQHEGSGDRLLYVGRLAAMKGLPVLFESLSKLRQKYSNVHLTVVGDGGERRDIEAIAQQLGVADLIDFVGYKSQTEVREYLQQTDIFVLPSFAEGVPVVLMEAMAAGVPVVTTRIAGVPELVEQGESGWLVPPGDVEALVDGLSQLIESPALRNQYGKAGHAKVAAEFNIITEARKLGDIFRQEVSSAVSADPVPAAIVEQTEPSILQQ